MSYAHIRRLPYPPLLLRVLRTSAAVWLLAQLAYVLLLLVAVLLGLIPLAEARSAALRPAALSRVLLVALTAVLVWVDRKRDHEHVLQANFGVSPLWFWTASLLSAAVLDVGTHALLRVF